MVVLEEKEEGFFLKAFLETKTISIKMIILHISVEICSEDTGLSFFTRKKKKCLELRKVQRRRWRQESTQVLPSTKENCRGTELVQSTLLESLQGLILAGLSSGGLEGLAL